MLDLSPDIREVIEAVTIESPTRYTIEGEPREVRPPADQNQDASEVPLVKRLQDEMYARLYCYSSSGGAQYDELADREFLTRLSDANTGKGTWEPGWVISGIQDEGRIPVRKEGLVLWVTPAQLRSQSRGYRPGARCRVRIGNELRELMPGFYVMIGDGNEADLSDREEQLVRLYWNINPEGAVALVDALTSLINPLRIPFRAKVVNSHVGYPRADAGVFYLDKSLYPRVHAVVPLVYARVREHLRPQVPRFSKRLADGLGLAEDPRNDESFGQHRCRVITEALWRAHQQGRVALEQQVESVVQAFGELGFDPLRPHLQPRSADDYPVLDDELLSRADSAPDELLEQARRANARPPSASPRSFGPGSRTRRKSTAKAKRKKSAQKKARRSQRR